MEAIRDTQKRYGSAAMAVAIFAGLALILAGYKPMAKGLILGTLFSVFNFVLMGETLALRISPSRTRSSVLSLGTALFRYLLLALPLIVAVKTDTFDLVSTVIGIFMIQLMVLGDHLSGAFGSRRKRGF